MGILPFDVYPLTTELMAWYNPIEAARGVVGSMPTIFWGEMYANFGLFGVVIVPFFLGYFIYFINTVIFKMEKNIITVSFLIWIAMYFTQFNTTALRIVDLYLYAISIVFILLLFINGKGEIKFREVVKS
ncbi:MAG: hypothetical protein QS748_09060 [Candidatus Endonucleobacter bathymodioli]|uniref:O-antigen polysaccharide polymerase Wzy n=1 Tax=Candidatus Endonucleibacter bathymodioli TaxID=539814 RepID=A0AA90SDH0_9GAMM|nr:hypothetical protein [Candidatus Endonucleobacter bathymodioli]